MISNQNSFKTVSFSLALLIESQVGDKTLREQSHFFFNEIAIQNYIQSKFFFFLIQINNIPWVHWSKSTKPHGLVYISVLFFSIEQRIKFSLAKSNQNTSIFCSAAYKNLEENHFFEARPTCDNPK